MTPDLAAELLASALRLVSLIVVILIAPSLLVGVLVSLFQAATQINEQTMSFLPRLLVTLASIALTGGFVSEKLITFTRDLFMRAAQLVG